MSAVPDGVERDLHGAHVGAVNVSTGRPASYEEPSTEPTAWERQACLVARRNLTSDEREFLPDRHFEPVCPEKKASAATGN